MTDKLEEQIVAAGADKAPRITNAHIEGCIKETHFYVVGDAVKAGGLNLPDGSSLNRLTACVLVLQNGFTITGESACVSPENFDEQIGRDIAYRNAFDKIWLLEGYLLRQELHDAQVDTDLVAGLNDCEGCVI